MVYLGVIENETQKIAGMQGFFFYILPTAIQESTSGIQIVSLHLHFNRQNGIGVYRTSILLYQVFV